MGKLKKMTQKKYYEIIANELNQENDWHQICLEYRLSEKFIEEFKNKVDWENILIDQNISEDFIEKHLQEIEKYRVISSFTGNECWNVISSDRQLSENFMRKYQDKVNWEYIFRYQRLSKEFKKEFEYKLR